MPRSIVEEKPRSHGSDLLPLLMKYLELWISPSVETPSPYDWALLLFALDALNTCVDANISSPRAGKLVQEFISVKSGMSSWSK